MCGSQQGRSNLERALLAASSNKNSLLESQTLSPIKLAGERERERERLKKVGERGRDRLAQNPELPRGRASVHSPPGGDIGDGSQKL